VYDFIFYTEMFCNYLGFICVNHDKQGTEELCIRILGNEFCLQNAEVEFCAVQEKDRLPKPCRPGMS